MDKNKIPEKIKESILNIQKFCNKRYNENMFGDMNCENCPFYMNFSSDIKCQLLDENPFEWDLIIKFKENKK